MEKTRRRRINNALDQLRTLLPFSVNMKKDMASLLEQTVEYINIMHTVLNEDKPVCLNKIYLCYRKKTEELESFRKNLKKTVQKRVKAEPGCSWGPNYSNFAHQGATDVDTFVKFHGITSSYPDPNRLNPGHWKISNCPPPPSNPIAYGKSNSQVNYSLAHSNQASRTNFYQPSTSIPAKMYEPSCSQGSNQSQTNNEQVQTPTEIGKIHHPMVKSDCWQPAQNYQLKQQGEAGSSRSSVAHHAAGSSTGASNDWYRYYGMQNTKQVLDLQERTNQVHQMAESACYDENNNEPSSSAATLGEQSTSQPTPRKNTNDALKDNSESVTVSSPNQTPEAVKDVDSSSCNITNAAIATGLLKCTSLAKQESNSPPEFFFTNNPDSNNISNAFNALNSWMGPCTSLPALSLAHNYLGSQQQHGSNITVNNNSAAASSPVDENAAQLKGNGIQMVKTPP